METAVKWVAYDLLLAVFKVPIFANGSLEKKRKFKVISVKIIFIPFAFLH